MFTMHSTYLQCRIRQSIVQRMIWSRFDAVYKIILHFNSCRSLRYDVSQYFEIGRMFLIDLGLHFCCKYLVTYDTCTMDPTTKMLQLLTLSKNLKIFSTPFCHLFRALFLVLFPPGRHLYTLLTFYVSLCTFTISAPLIRVQSATL